MTEAREATPLVLKPPMRASHRAVLIVGFWWAVVMVMSLPAIIGLVRDEGSTSIVLVVAHALAGFLWGPQVLGDSSWPFFFAWCWPGYAVLARKLLARDWSFRGGLQVSAVAALAMPLAHAVLALAKLSHDGLLVPDSTLLRAMAGGLGDYAHLFIIFFISATVANGLSALVLGRHTHGQGI